MRKKFSVSLKFTNSESSENIGIKKLFTSSALRMKFSASEFAIGIIISDRFKNVKTINLALKKSIGRNRGAAFFKAEELKERCFHDFGRCGMGRIKLIRILSDFHFRTTGKLEVNESKW